MAAPNKRLSGLGSEAEALPPTPEPRRQGFEAYIPAVPSSLGQAWNADNTSTERESQTQSLSPSSTASHRSIGGLSATTDKSDPFRPTRTVHPPVGTSQGEGQIKQVPRVRATGVLEPPLELTGFSRPPRVSTVDLLGHAYPPPPPGFGEADRGRAGLYDMPLHMIPSNYATRPLSSLQPPLGSAVDPLGRTFPPPPPPPAFGEGVRVQPGLYGMPPGMIPGNHATHPPNLPQPPLGMAPLGHTYPPPPPGFEEHHRGQSGLYGMPLNMIPGNHGMHPHSLPQPPPGSTVDHLGNIHPPPPPGYDESDRGQSGLYGMPLDMIPSYYPPLAYHPDQPGRLVQVFGPPHPYLPMPPHIPAPPIDQIAAGLPTNQPTLPLVPMQQSPTVDRTPEPTSMIDEYPVTPPARLPVAPFELTPTANHMPQLPLSLSFDPSRTPRRDTASAQTSPQEISSNNTTPPQGFALNPESPAWVPGNDL
ncbi:hypothetical protein G7Z17_g7858 [Cylindrodendrum hubeiense]|uniref:Uncharacterized protein n=1 Tax=Cylindrodendrum hubeiense TaxID=595255 RepID=A0A9P5H725_9HYPO|nr:hypothetical protein G7Z17_g7858 [Cylindrodendrum hubeiense]